jgi:3'-phosphoadenosine 5'-phosphosulfate (PAPS) 3'-phosphatase
LLRAPRCAPQTITELGYNLVPSLASGNRAMMLLENKAGWYIRDTGGFALWDTSGPQACLEAYGGTMSKLPQVSMLRTARWRHRRSRLGRRLTFARHPPPSRPCSS